MIVSFLHGLWEFVQTPQVASALISVAGLGTIAFIGHKLVCLSAKENLAIAERKLFLDLIKDRTHWSKDATKLFLELVCTVMITDGDEFYSKNNSAIQTLTDLYNLSVSARWLFGTEVAEKHKELCSALQNLYGQRRELEWIIQLEGKTVRRPGGKRELKGLEGAMKKVGDLDFAIDEMLTDYLYVGDIKRSTLSIHKEIPESKWFTWKERSWDASRTDN